MAVNKTDLIGYNNGRLIVNSFSRQEERGNRLRSLWNVTCLFCGKEFEQTRDKIVSGNGAPCGCYRREFGRKIGQSNHIDLTGKIIGEWFVESRANDYVNKSGVHAVRYNCVCSCGERAIVLASSLMNGESLSCGHGRQDLIASILFKDLTGQQIYEWHVDYRIPGTDPIKYHCTCSCGIERDVLGQTLRSGGSRSCGHVKASHGEMEIKTVLDANGIKYKYDCTYNELTKQCGKQLRLDFQIFDDNGTIICAIEYQGEQHYKSYICYGVDFGKQQREETDIIKRNFFRSKNIPLYEIPYNKDAMEMTYAILAKHHLINDNTVPSSQEIA